MDLEKEMIEKKIKDINAIEFGDSVEDVSSSLLIVMTLFEIDDDPDVLKACKLKLYEGISLLKKYGDDRGAKKIESEIEKDS
jgi:hypothetical protein